MCFAKEADLSRELVHQEADCPREFAQEVLRRLPLAEAVLGLWRWIADPQFLQDLFAQHRGRGYEQSISFPVLVQLIADVLLEHAGSGRKSFQRGQEHGHLAASLQAAYQKLGRLPLRLSEAFVAESTARLQALYPAGARVALSPSVRGFQVVVVDGKTVKRVAKRLKAVRGRKGGVLGGKALVAVALGSGLGVALATAADGETNDAKLIPALVPQVRAQVAGPRLWVSDRQFCDLTQPAVYAADGDHYVVRYHPKTAFCRDETQPWCWGEDAEGREWGEEWGWLGREGNPKRRYVRRITLFRSADEDVSIVTDLLEAPHYPAAELLALYGARWEIEQVFQQISEVFHLQTLIGTTPQGTVFQFAFCLLLYNLIQVVRAYVAAAQARPVPTISLELLFDDVHRQLIALTELVPPPRIAELFEPPLSGAALGRRLHQLLGGVWTPRWLKAPPQKRKPSPARPAPPGKHTSIYRILEDYRRHLKSPLRPAHSC
jgi:hypothetical protein